MGFEVPGDHIGHFNNVLLLQGKITEQFNIIIRYNEDADKTRVSVLFGMTDENYIDCLSMDRVLSELIGTYDPITVWRKDVE